MSSIGNYKTKWRRRLLLHKTISLDGRTKSTISISRALNYNKAKSRVIKAEIINTLRQEFNQNDVKISVSASRETLQVHYRATAFFCVRNWTVFVIRTRENKKLWRQKKCTNFSTLQEVKVSKVKVTLVQALRLCTGRTAHRGSRGIALPFHDHGTIKGWGSASSSGSSLPPGKTRYPLYRRLGGPQGRSGKERRISPHRDSIPDRPARSSVAIPTELPGPLTAGRSVY